MDWFTEYYPLSQMALYFYFVDFYSAVLYVLSYSQYFILGGSWKNFLNYKNQMWWYNTSLKATTLTNPPGGLGLLCSGRFGTL